MKHLILFLGLILVGFSLESQTIKIPKTPIKVGNVTYNVQISENSPNNMKIEVFDLLDPEPIATTNVSPVSLQNIKNGLQEQLELMVPEEAFTAESNSTTENTANAEEEEVGTASETEKEKSYDETFRDILLLAAQAATMNNENGPEAGILTVKKTVQIEAVEEKDALAFLQNEIDSITTRRRLFIQEFSPFLIDFFPANEELESVKSSMRSIDVEGNSSKLQDDLSSCRKKLESYSKNQAKSLKDSTEVEALLKQTKTLKGGIDSLSYLEKYRKARNQLEIDLTKEFAKIKNNDRLLILISNHFSNAEKDPFKKIDWDSFEDKMGAEIDKLKITNLQKTQLNFAISQAVRKFTENNPLPDPSLIKQVELYQSIVSNPKVQSIIKNEANDFKVSNNRLLLGELNAPYLKGLFETIEKGLQNSLPKSKFLKTKKARLDKYSKQVNEMMKLVENLANGDELFKIYQEARLLKSRIEGEECSDLLDIILNTVSINKLDGCLKQLEDKTDCTEDIQLNDLKNAIRGGGTDFLIEFTVDDIEIEFLNGFIENLKVVGHISHDRSKTPMIFTNTFPLGFSRKVDFHRLSSYSLYSNQDPHPKGRYTGDLRSKYKMIVGTNLIHYDFTTKSLRRDFSPGNSVKNINPPFKEALSKSPTYQILEAKVFSDFNGFDNSNPNGLVQIEVDRPFRLITRRRVRSTQNTLGLYSNFGWLQSFTPRIVISKIEENNRVLPLSKRSVCANNQAFSSFAASTVELRQYAYLQFGASTNLFLWDIPNVKATFYLNAGAYGLLTQVQEPVDTNGDTPEAFTAKSVNTSLEVVVQLFQDERFGGSLNAELNYLNMVNVNSSDPTSPFIQVGDVKTFEEKETVYQGENLKDRYYLTMGIKEFFFKPDPESANRLFFRYQYHFSLTESNINFQQLQLGYNFYILSNYKKK